MNVGSYNKFDETELDADAPTVSIMHAAPTNSGDENFFDFAFHWNSM
jgi:hypothetical protein